MDIVNVSKILSEGQPGAMLSWFDFQSKAARQGSVYLQYRDLNVMNQPMNSKTK